MICSQYDRHAWRRGQVSLLGHVNHHHRHHYCHIITCIYSEIFFLQICHSIKNFLEKKREREKFQVRVRSRGVLEFIGQTTRIQTMFREMMRKRPRPRDHISKSISQSISHHNENDDDNNKRIFNNNRPTIIDKTKKS